MTVLKPFQVATYAYVGGWVKQTDNHLAMAIAMAESGGKTDARNPSSGARGLWQILPSTARDVGRDYNQLDDPSYNAHVAHEVWKRQGWTAWSTYTSGAYKRYLSASDTPPLPGLPNLPGQTTLSDVGAGLHDVGRAGQWLADPHSWLRVVQVAAGGALLIGAGLVIARPVTDAAAPVVKAAAKVAAA